MDEEVHQQQQSQPQQPVDMHAAVLGYLRQMGYRQTEQFFQAESQGAKEGPGGKEGETGGGLEVLAFEMRTDQDSSLSNALIIDTAVQAPSASSGDTSGASLHDDKSTISSQSGQSSTAGTSAATSNTGMVGMYTGAFAKLRTWIHESLDMFRDELIPVLYPVYVHIFLELVAKGHPMEAHVFRDRFSQDVTGADGGSGASAEELARLAAITEPHHVGENATAQVFRGGKYSVSMSAYGFQLLMNFLQENRFFLVIKIINQFLNIRVLVTRPVPSGATSGASAAAASMAGLVQGISGLNGGAGGSAVNAEPIRWGYRPYDAQSEFELTSRIKADLRAYQSQHQHPHPSGGTPIPPASPTAGPTTGGTAGSNLLQASHIGAYKQMMRDSSPSAPDPALLAAVRPPVTTAEIDFEVEKLKQLSRRALLSSSGSTAATPPSVCCFTLHNAADGVLTSMDFSADATLMATGSRDSYIDVWNLRADGAGGRGRLAALKPSTELAAMDFHALSSTDLLMSPDAADTRRLIGHSGPVYAAKFSHDRQYLLSCSQDSTIRLWSLATYSNVVAYKGHTLPVWDIDIAAPPFSHWFVSASADRTARLWSTDSVQPLRIFAGHYGDVDCVRFHPNAMYIATGSSDRSVRIWDVNSGACVRVFGGTGSPFVGTPAGPHDAPVLTVEFSPNGRFLASADALGVVKLWDIAEGRLVRTLSSKTATPVFSLSFCQDSQTLVATGRDSSVRIWSVQAARNSALPIDSALPPSLVLHTKSTPIWKAQFTYSNVLMVAGPSMPLESL